MPDEDIRLSGIDSRLSRIEGIIEQMDKRLSNVESQIQRLNDKTDSMYKWNIGLLLGLILPLYGLILFNIIAK